MREDICKITSCHYGQTDRHTEQTISEKNISKKLQTTCKIKTAILHT